MGEFISYAERPAKARGLRKSALPREQKVREYLFSHEYDGLNRLPRLPNPSSHPLLIYPGCGADILFPLHYVEKLYTAEISFLFIDVDDNYGILKTVLDDVGVSFTENQKEHKIQFYWKGTLVHLKFILGDIFTLLPTLPAFDIYFERAFGIMKDTHKEYEQQIYEKLKPKGLLISDSGFKDVSLRRINVPSELSSYGEMVVGLSEV